MRKLVLTGAAVAALALPAATAIPTAASAASAAPARRCSQNLRVTHSSTSATLTIITRYCGRSYRAWAGFNIHGIVYGPWRDTNGAQSVVYYAGGGNEGGGYQYEPTGGGTITTHTSY